MPPVGELGASPRTERDGDAPIGTNHTSHEVAMRLSFSGEESHSPSFAPCDKESRPPRSSFLSGTHTVDAPEGLRLELEDEEEDPREISPTMGLTRNEEQGLIAPLSTEADERARPQPWNEYRIPVTHRQASSVSCSCSSGEYPLAGQGGGALARGATGLAPNGIEKDRESLGDPYREAPKVGNKELKCS